MISTTTNGVKLLCQGTDVIVEGAGSPGVYYFAEGLAKITYLGAGIFNVEGVVPSGSGRDFFTSTVPRGWLRRDGSLLNRTTYAALFGRLGTTWGIGDGSTTFGIPDDRGSVQIGDGQGSGLTNRTVAQIGGEETHLLSIAEIPAHTHSQFGGGTNPNIGGGTNVQTDNALSLTGSTGGGGSHNTMPPFIVCLKAIKY